ncbi:hypothetical protein FB451DRAFT_1247615 [Mycena latifolia]|nr:hypothetical protein FB451DRAFT_1247615 [Mycena latifolia]
MWLLYGQARLRHNLGAEKIRKSCETTVSKIQETALDSRGQDPNCKRTNSSSSGSFLRVLDVLLLYRGRHLCRRWRPVVKQHCRRRDGRCRRLCRALGLDACHEEQHQEYDEDNLEPAEEVKQCCGNVGKERLLERHDATLEELRGEEECAGYGRHDPADDSGLGLDCGGLCVRNGSLRLGQRSRGTVLELCGGGREGNRLGAGEPFIRVAHERANEEASDKEEEHCRSLGVRVRGPSDGDGQSGGLGVAFENAGCEE